MSTTSKGDRFELKTQKLLTQVLRNGRFELKLEGESEFWIVLKIPMSSIRKNISMCMEAKLL